MKSPESLSSAIFEIRSATEFYLLALDIFRFQARENPVYRQFIELMGVDAESVKSPDQIPFLPIEFFKTHHILCTGKTTEKTFLSSATTGQIQSKHPVADLGIYEKSFLKGFELFYGNISQYTILALLPSYQQREGSSLIYMVNEMIQRSNNAESGYFLNEDEKLFDTLKHLESQGRKSILIGVSYALLDFVEHFKMHLKNTIIMETGGMKGKRKELVKEELHAILKNGFGVTEIHSEYSMTELLSQAYSKGEGIYFCPPWMKIMIRDVNEPSRVLPAGQSGGINIIDFANIYSCSFIATQDLGKTFGDGSFNVLGRFDNSDVRGCNLLVGG